MKLLRILQLALCFYITLISFCSCAAGENTQQLNINTDSFNAAPSETISKPVSSETFSEKSSPAETLSVETEVSETMDPEPDIHSDRPVIISDGIVFEGEEASSGFIDSVEETVNAAMNEFALFFINKGYYLDSYVDPDSDLYGYLFGSDKYNRIYNEYYNYEYVESWSYSLFESSDYLVYGDKYFTADIRYKLDIVFSDPSRLEDDNQKADQLWTFRNTGTGWKLCDISNNDQISPDAVRTGQIQPLCSYDGINVYSLRGKDYDGAVMLLDDASRVFCGTVPVFAYDYGQTVPEMINAYEGNGYHIAGGINGGNFDDGGTGSSYTAMPLGLVISEGKVVFNEYSEGHPYHLAGFTDDGEFVIGTMTISEALDTGIRDAVYTTEKDGPFLVMDGNIQYDQLPDTSVYGAGKNPRTCIGQMKDGTVMMLTVNGRQPSSLGASFEDLAEIMLSLGAENASAMDGGTSSQMILDGEILNQPFSAFGLRMCPTAWLIRD